MRLISFSMQNYRRFVSRTTIKLHGQMVAIVGPNEAGKSSLLQALARLGNPEPFDRSEYPRRCDGDPVLEWHFALDDSDIGILKMIPEALGVKTVTLTRSAFSDARSWSFGPASPTRDLADRHHLAELLMHNADALAHIAVEGEPVAERPVTAQLLARAQELSEDKKPNLDEDELRSLEELGDSLEQAVAYLTADGGEENKPVELGSLLAELAEAVSRTRATELKKAPAVLAREALVERVPTIEVFKQEDRDLESSYDLVEHADSAPPALMHLASLAELDLKELLREVQEGAIADIGTRRNAANRVLLDRFDQAWNQQGIAIQIEVQGTVLHVQATTPEDSGLSSIAERSDGLRWFAALLAWSHGWDTKPIILADEIETHLHYDAQSDLIDVLAQQEFASKVIYTTHSFGCLPHDLGTGVRAVEQIDGATSRIENAFWQKGAGFSPLLASMGAAATSLTPTRHAILAEGPSDAILLPTLLRQSADLPALRFQVAPGLASVAAIAVGSLDAEAGRVGFLVDGDQSGLEIRTMLLAGGVEEDRIILLADQESGNAIELEDLIDPDVYVTSVNAELARWQADAPPMALSDLTPTMRSKSVEAWAASHSVAAPDKTTVSQAVIDLSADRIVFDITRQSTVEWLLNRCSTVLGLPAT